MIGVLPIRDAGERGNGGGNAPLAVSKGGKRGRRSLCIKTS